MSIVKTGHECLALAINHLCTATPYIPQQVVTANQPDFPVPDSHQFRPGLHGVHSYYIGVSENKVCGWHGTTCSFDVVATG